MSPRAINQEWLNSLENYSVEELQIELDNERQALEDIKTDQDYDDKARQLEVTRNNLRVIQAIIGRKTGSRH